MIPTPAFRRLAAAAVLPALLSITSAMSMTPQCPGIDDAFEDNDDCASAVAIPVGLTPGLYTETRVGDHDYYSFQVPPGEVATIELFFTHANGNVDVLVSGAGCSGVIGVGFSPNDDERVEIVNGGNQPLDLVIEVFVTSVTASDCNTYDLLISTSPDPCVGAADDALEGNDDCGSALLLGPGSYPDLMVFSEDLDYYRLLVPSGEELRIDCDHVHASGDISLFLYDPNIGCGGGFGSGPVALTITQTDDESLRWTNTGTAAVELILEVSLSPIVASSCNAYDLDVALVPSACSRPDDPLEDNDDCASALPLSPGSFPNLFVSADDPDFYSVTVAPGDVLGVDCHYTWLEGALVVLFWDPAVGCGTGLFTYEIARGFTPVDNERVFWVNETGAAVEVIVEISTSPAPGVHCNVYDLMIETFPNPCPGGLGAILCRGVANSTGVGASLCASGSDLVGDNNVTLTVSELPANSMGMFIVSPGAVVTLADPAGSVGQLCVASPSIGRQLPVLNSGASGMASLQLDLLMTAQPNGPVAIEPGETWCWQFWHRDLDPMGAAISNFSSARCITFR